MKRKLIYSLIIFMLISYGCSNNGGNTGVSNTTLRVYAAAGIRSVTENICDLFEADNKCKIERNYASSGTLARQIASGAVTDVYVSANKQWIDYLLKEGLLDEGSVTKIAGNSLAIIAPADIKELPIIFDANFDINSIIPDKIVIGDPGYVPVGKYTKQVFDSLDWTNKLTEKTIMTKDVTSVLHLVELGECDWGVVYKSEALLSSKVNIVAEIPQGFHKKITFYVATVKGHEDLGLELAKAFYSDSGLKIFKEFGFFL